MADQDMAIQAPGVSDTTANSGTKVGYDSELVTAITNRKKEIAYASIPTLLSNPTGQAQTAGGFVA